MICTSVLGVLEMGKQCEGVTLIELIITLAIIGIITFIGVPSFNNTIRSNRLATSANELVSSLELARNEAIERNRRVVVRTTDANGFWENGWQVFVDADSDNILTIDANSCNATDKDCLLQVHEALPNNYTLRFKGGFGITNYVRYSPDGSISSNGTFSLCENNDGNNIPEANTAKTIILNTIGRPRTGTDSDENGVPEDSNGKNITTCK